MSDLREQYFVFNEHEQVFKCKVDGCTGRIKDSTSSLRRHMAQLHPDIAARMGITAYKRKSLQTEPPRPAKRLKAITVYVDPIEFHCSLMQMPAAKSIPFNFFNSKPCRSTIGVLAKALNIPAYGEAVASDVTKIANIIRQMISAELQGFFCLEFDGAQRHNRKIFGINARVLANGKFKTRTLSMMEISTRQTGENLKTRIEEVLAIHKTDVKHIYSCTTDNGKNMLKCVSELDKSQQLALDAEFNAQSDENATGSVPEEDGIDLENELEDTTEGDVAKLDDEVDEMLEAVENIFLDGNESCIATLKCTAHTVNLVVKDVVNVDDEVLKKIRKVTKACRKTEYGPFFDLGKIPLPKVDVETRWGSLFKMIESFHHNALFFKDLGQKFPELNLTDEEWVYIEEFIAAFEPLHVVSKNVQADDLVLGDVYKFLKICQLKIKKIPAGNRFSESLESALHTRAKKMLDNDAVRAALLFDQRWCFVDSPYVSTEDKLAAIVSIIFSILINTMHLDLNLSDGSRVHQKVFFNLNGFITTKLSGRCKTLLVVKRGLIGLRDIRGFQRFK
ncbi:uncharacterized protein LOC109403457 [Aedes albopictus]|uniref:C2H2-type domain-containing protein n=1 Tax=Aedes albopictus TaxID=7160 RepID=A0ABM1Y580_AEDAL